jgi:hypothetical protein
MHDKIRANFALHFNKAALTEANLLRLEKKMFLTSSVSDPNKVKDKRNMWMRKSVLIWRSQFFEHPNNPQRNDLQNSRF